MPRAGCAWRGAVMCEVADAVDDLRRLIARAEALATATEGLFDNPFEIDDEDDRRRLERVVHLLGATVSAVRAPANRESATEAIVAARGGTLCVRRARLPHDFASITTRILATQEIQYIVCAGEEDDRDPLLVHSPPSASPFGELTSVTLAAQRQQRCKPVARPSPLAVAVLAVD